MKRILILYTAVENTQWNDEVGGKVVSRIIQCLESKYAVHAHVFTGFQGLEKLVETYDLVFNLCYGYYSEKERVNITQTDITYWLDTKGISHTTSLFPSAIKALDKGKYFELCANIEGLYSVPMYGTDKIIQKPRYGGCGRDVAMYEDEKLCPSLKKDFIQQTYIEGRELSVFTVLGKVLKPYEVKTKFIKSIGDSDKERYILEMKSDITLDPKLDDEVLVNLYRVVKELHEVNKFVGITRLDLIVESTFQHLYLLDINICPSIGEFNSMLAWSLHNNNLKY
jgi:hypothetical protein